ncbi:MAG: membrane protein [Rhodospirillaceae bacterium BRH_c57]|nr:MAG: membrane protein [Rhodospirillaceae bacterium BRH_c57]
MFSQNVGGIDRILRIVVGLALVALAATGTVGLWGYIGVVPLVTGLVGWCPVYLPFGLKTCRAK